ncbi:ribonuclease H-like domain-containing protein [Trametes elegans]|nr:ribonuclease H-like domain-containing protein [Trametes elegans]
MSSSPFVLPRPALAVPLVLAALCLTVLIRRRLQQTTVPGPGAHDSQSSPYQDMPTKVQRDVPVSVKQRYDAFLVLDVEATCVEGAGFDYPNEIIEWPVCLLRWKDSPKGKARELEVVDEFRSFVRPTWRPQLSAFCTALTGITQEQVDSAPPFPDVLDSFQRFLERHGLIEPETGRRLARFCFCSDGPYDVRDFVVKQCFISKIPLPPWLAADVMDVRRTVGEWHAATAADADKRLSGAFPIPRRVTLSIPRQLHALGLEPFEGRQHSGIDDTRNISRLVVELARRGWRLAPNTPINPKRRWPWMGKRGQVLEEYYP